MEIDDFVIDPEDKNVTLILEVLTAPANLPRADAASVEWLREFFGGAVEPTAVEEASFGDGKRV